MRKILKLFLLSSGLTFTLCSCSAVGDILAALVPNNTVTVNGTSYTVSSADYGKNTGYCSGQIFLIIASNSVQGEIRVVLAEIPNTNSAYSVTTPTRNNCNGSQSAFVRSDAGGTLGFSDSGSCTLNDVGKVFKLDNVKLSNGKTINGRGDYK